MRAAYTLCALALTAAAPAQSGCAERGRALGEWPTEVHAPPAPRATAGPIGDFEPVDRVLTHERVGLVAPELAGKLTALFGRRHAVARYRGAGNAEDKTLLWLRDYAPLYVREPDGAVVALGYLSESPNRLGQAPPGIRTRPLPLLHEQGGLVVAGRQLVVGERLFRQNARPLDAPHLRAAGYRPRTRAEVLSLFARAVHRAPEDLVVLPAMPYEATGHVDMFVLALGPGTVAVPQIEDEAVALLAAGEARTVAAEVQRFLEAQAATLAAHGLTVVRLPMVPPALAPPAHAGEDAAASAEGRRDFALLLFSPANALLVDDGRRRHALWPSFRGVFEDARMAAASDRYAERWNAAFREAGWEPVAVDSSVLVAYLGLLRCVTAVVPSGSSRTRPNRSP